MSASFAVLSGKLFWDRDARFRCPSFSCFAVSHSMAAKAEKREVVHVVIAVAVLLSFVVDMA